MDTSSFKPEELGISQRAFDQGQEHSGHSGIEGAGLVTDNSNLGRPFRRAIKGFMSLLSGDVDNEIESATQAYFEKVRSSEQSSVHAGGFNRFQRALRRVRYFSQFNPQRTPDAPLGTFGGRSIIGEGGAINGGVYLGAVPQEALVVDDRHGALERIYNELVVRLAEVSIDHKLEESEILPEVSSLVVRHLHFDEKDVRELTEREGVAPDDKVAIDMYLYEHVGVARHQVLVAGYLIERLRKRGVLSGCMTIDSMSQHLMGHDDRLIYTSPHGYLFIFDPLKLNQ